MRKSSRKGFTLIELLVVIAIIAILAAILFPVFAKAREKARQASSTSNVKQLSLGILMYVDDYDGTFPPCVMENDKLVDGSNNVWGADSCVNAGWSYYNDPGYFLWSWHDLIYPYTKSWKVMNCPSSSWAQGGAFGIAQGSYGANVGIMGWPHILRHDGVATPGFDGQDLGGNGADGPKNTSQVAEPASKYLIMDWGNYAASSAYALRPYDSWYLPGSGAIQEVKDWNASLDDYHKVGGTYSGWSIYGGSTSDFENGRHLGGICVAYADGHTKWVKSEVVYKAAKDHYWNLDHPSELRKDPWDPAYAAE